DVPPAPTTDEWIAILKLSTQWMMLDIRRVAITVLSSANVRPADRVVLAREYKVDSWLRSAYLELVNTASSMSQEDMNKVGLASAFKIHKARERYMNSASNNSSRGLFPIGHAIVPISQQQNKSFRFQEITTERSAIERVSLARVHGVSEWLREAFIELVKRHEPLTVDESRTLGFDTAIRLYNARERRLTRRTTMLLPPSTSISTTINQELKEELGALTTYQPVERAVLAQKYGVVEWLHQALVELMERSKAISVSEAKMLGYETAIRLCIAREAYAINTHNLHFGWNSNSYVGDGNVEGFIDEELADELSAIPSHGPVDRVLIAREAGVDQWLQTALNELVRRKEMVTDDEAVALGLDTCIQLCRCRLENLGNSQSTWANPGEINVEFKVELNDIQQASERYIQPGIVLEEEEEEQAPAVVELNSNAQADKPYIPPYIPPRFGLWSPAAAPVKKGLNKKTKKKK
ncbi:hypothetical protein C0993_007501, partial [Termitomyces sp. T159_Od127]